MANALAQQPLYLDTDQTVAYKSEPTVVALGSPLGVQVTNITLDAPTGNATALGTILVTDGATTPITLFKATVNASTQFPLRFFYDVPLQWRNFKTSGLTATGTTMQIWTR